MTFSVDSNGDIVVDEKLVSPSDDLFETDPEAVQEVLDDSAGYIGAVSGGDGFLPFYDTQSVSVLSEGVQFLASDNAAANGYVSDTVLGLMDRIVDAYGSYFEYLGFRTDPDDAYSAVLYIGEKGSGYGRSVRFVGEVLQVTFSRSGSNYDRVPYLDVSVTSDLTVSLAPRSVVYTDCLSGYPTLGSRVVQDFPVTGIIVSLFVVVLAAIFFRQRPRG